MPGGCLLDQVMSRQTQLVLASLLLCGVLSMLIHIYTACTTFAGHMVFRVDNKV